MTGDSGARAAGKSSEHLVVDGQSVAFEHGQTIAAALLAADRTSWRTTRTGRPRGIFCGIGVCFDCLVTTNGRRVRACLEPARPGDVVTTGPVSTDVTESPRESLRESPREVPHEPAVRTGPALPTRCDAVVVGAGPAGLTAANAMAEHGLSVVLLDVGERPGGQYYRHCVGGGSGAAASPRFRTLRAELDRHVVAGRVDYRPRHQVWTLERTTPPIPAPAAAPPADPVWTVHAVAEGPEPSPVQVLAPAVVVATGGYDRQLPFPGWDLPGVVAAGGAQALLKGSGVALGGPGGPGGRVVVAGSGPFLLPVATGLAQAGAEVAGVYEASRARDYLRHARTLARQPGRFGEAAGYARDLARHRVPYRTGHAVVAAHGDERLTGVTVARLDGQRRPIPGSERRVECGTLAVGYGFTPQLDLLVEVGCDVSTGTGGSTAVLVDADQATTCAGLYSAGETTGVGGAALALAEGELAGLAVVAATGRPVEEQRKAGLTRRKDSLRAFADVLDAVHPLPVGWLDDLPDETVLCRCEEVPVGAVREAVRDLGAGDPRSAKLLTRTGMGWCQGRTCAAATAALVGRLTGSPPDGTDAAALARRPVAQPVPLGVLASLADLPPTHVMDSDEPSGGTAR
ncbi:Thioredoxin reductase [Actinopolymorpha cephalotaxi]|uniref:NADPH-dependent 2,4-dienoyl-CoA reductase/sulfur reductase-like enzyme n=1 Tax=Actinopolymorpha cephalotaxi TaxID=504797 RepID=A0A1I2VDY5_9ACTN|nr:2Fe-2S iron-sulfur cluster-binding protein [Actinopolymorpha cephalotaxi]NYH84849.1 NADPH-dependent 2,4-dienoyl-CoA reductase/sulfur reductase-like enzyme [Actinopolymorpha cephalotaxi]SFG87422.1 Thioredoxin reductase [Actinopolymorpha cephalotaxi]